MNPTSRRAFIAQAAALLAVPAWAALPKTEGGELVEVWKSPTCGCCAEWIEHMEAHGFRVKVNNTPNPPARARLGVDLRYGSCHTALVGGYAVEGHVPAREVRRLLKERPQAIGLAVPGMPIGSPGMDSPVYDGRKDPYDVLLVLKGGGARVFASYR